MKTKPRHIKADACWWVSSLTWDKVLVYKPYRGLLHSQGLFKATKSLTCMNKFPNI